VQSGEEQELGKLLNIALANASANPHAMMVMYLDTHFASIAMERARRAQNLARVTIRDFVHFFGKRLVDTHGKVLEFFG
jgi:hypothetical protein